MTSADKITTEQLERALRTAAGIVAAPGGEVYVPIFERLENELLARRRKNDARERARRIAVASVAEAL